MYSQENKNMVCVPIADYTALVECRAKLSIIAHMVERGKTIYATDEILKDVLGIPSTQSGATEDSDIGTGANNGL